MSHRRSSPGFGQWLLVTLLITGVLFLLYQLYQYSSVRANFPEGLEIASVDVGGMTRAEAEQILTDRYLLASLILYHRDVPIEIQPTQAEFTLDFAKMMSDAEQERQEQDFWAGFWGYLWNRPIDVDPVPIEYDLNPDALRATIGVVAQEFDSPAEPPKPNTANMTFEYGRRGVETNIEASMDDVMAALLRPRDRVAHLVLEVTESADPEIALLNSLLINSVQEFEISSGGVASLFVVELNSGREVVYKPNVPMSGMDVLRIPLLVQAVRVLGEDIPFDQQTLLRQAATGIDPSSSNQLLTVLIGEDTPLAASRIFNAEMQKLGLRNTFISCPFDPETEVGCERIDTDANLNNASQVTPDIYRQTTAEDMGLLMTMLYDCAESNGGALRLVYKDQLSQAQCEYVLDLLAENNIDSLIEEGVPSDLRVAHRHGWQTDTYGDAGIIYTPGGDYVMVQFMHKSGWLAWEISSPLMADLSLATYNYFNFDEPYLSQR